LINIWFPKIRENFPDPSVHCKDIPMEKWSDEQDILKYSFHHPNIYLAPYFDQFPSHFHIDLVERAQGTGLGTVMLTRLLNELKSKGSKGVHLEMSSINDRALKFYKKFGFFELYRYNDNQTEVDLQKPHTLVLGKTL